MINLNVAGAVVHYDEFIKKLPVLKLKNKNINFTVYEGPNLCQWNGGRINREIFLTQEMLERYNKFGIAVSLTFTNPVINLEDETGNELIRMLVESGKKYNIRNKVVLVNEVLRQYLRDTTDLELIYSITGHPSDITLSNDTIHRYKILEEKYDWIVPKFEHVFEEFFYENVDTSKYELLINDTCVYGCPYYHEHFKAIAQQNFGVDNPWKDFGFDHCYEIEECWLPNFDPNVGSAKDKDKHGDKLGMNYTRDMIKKSLSLGYQAFKISGRENTTEFIVYEIETFCNDINERSK